MKDKRHRDTAASSFISFHLFLFTSDQTATSGCTHRELVHVAGFEWLRRNGARAQHWRNRHGSYRRVINKFSTPRHFLILCGWTWRCGAMHSLGIVVSTSTATYNPTAVAGLKTARWLYAAVSTQDLLHRSDFFLHPSSVWWQATNETKQPLLNVWLNSLRLWWELGKTAAWEWINACPQVWPASDWGGTLDEAVWKQLAALIKDDCKGLFFFYQRLFCTSFLCFISVLGQKRLKKGLGLSTAWKHSSSLVRANANRRTGSVESWTMVNLQNGILKKSKETLVRKVKTTYLTLA